MRFAHVNQIDLVAAVQARLERRYFNLVFRHASLRFRSGMLGHAAEFVIVDQLMDGPVGSADGALGAFAQFQLAELHVERVI